MKFRYIYSTIAMILICSSGGLNKPELMYIGMMMIWIYGLCKTFTDIGDFIFGSYENTITKIVQEELEKIKDEN